MSPWPPWLPLCLSHAADLAATAEARVAAFKKMLRTFEPMGTVVRDREPYRKDRLCRTGENPANVGGEPWPLFVPDGTAVGKAAPNQKSGASLTPSRKNSKV